MNETELAVLNQLALGHISIGRAAEMLGVTYYDIYSMAEAQGIELGATEEQSRRSRETAARLFRSRTE